MTVKRSLPTAQRASGAALFALLFARQVLIKFVGPGLSEITTRDSAAGAQDERSDGSGRRAKRRPEFSQCPCTAHAPADAHGTLYQCLIPVRHLVKRHPDLKCTAA